jgi:hypothetical protein
MLDSILLPGFLAYLTLIQLINAIGGESLAHLLPYLTERASPRVVHKGECSEELRREGKVRSKKEIYRY